MKIFRRRQDSRRAVRSHFWRRRGSRGFIILAVITGLLVAVGIFSGLIRQASEQHKAAQTSVRRMQAEWLAIAGLARARAQLQRSADYVGETWQIPESAFDGKISGDMNGEPGAEPASDADAPNSADAAKPGGKVVIRVEAVPEDAARRRIVVEAEWPAGSPRAARFAGESIISK